MMFYGQRTIRLKPHPNVAAKSLLAAPQTQSCQTFQKFQNPAVACCYAGLKNGIIMKYHGILKILESGMVNGCHTTNINQPQKIVIASSWHSLHCFLKLYHLCTKAPCLQPRRSASNCRQVTICLARLCRRWWRILFRPCPLWSLEWLKALIPITAYFLLLPKLSALWWCSRFFMGFHYLLTQKIQRSTSLSRGAWPPQPPQWQLPWWRTLFVGTQVPLGVRLPSALPEDDKRICKKIDLGKACCKLHHLHTSWYWIVPLNKKTIECSMQSVHSWPVMSCENFEQGVDMGLTYLHSLYMRLIVDILLLILLRTRSWSLTKGHRGRLLFRWETCLWTWGHAVQMNTCKIGILSFGKFSKCDHKTSQESECEAGVTWRTSNHPEHIKRPNPNTNKDIYDQSARKIHEQALVIITSLPCRRPLPLPHRQTVIVFINIILDFINIVVIVAVLLLFAFVVIVITAGDCHEHDLRECSIENKNMPTQLAKIPNYPSSRSDLLHSFLERSHFCFDQSGSLPGNGMQWERFNFPKTWGLAWPGPIASMCFSRGTCKWSTSKAVSHVTSAARSSQLWGPVGRENFQFGHPKSMTSVRKTISYHDHTWWKEKNLDYVYLLFMY